jgi:hypothetical protein
VLRPVLEQAAGMQLTVVQTQHEGHAADITLALELDSTDMLVVVGGDGTLFEAMQVGVGVGGKSGGQGRGLPCGGWATCPCARQRRQVGAGPSGRFCSGWQQGRAAAALLAWC